jgi:hypothetical protein
MIRFPTLRCIADEPIASASSGELCCATLVSIAGFTTWITVHRLKTTAAVPRCQQSDATAAMRWK